MNEENILTPDPPRPGLLFWLRWTALTIAGYGVGFLTGFVLGHMGGHTALGGVTGAMIAGLQFTFLRNWQRKPVRWVLAAVPGPALAGMTFDIAFHGFGVRIDFIPLMIAAGAVTGLLQGILLRYGRVFAVIYTLVSAAAWPLSMYGFSQPLYHGSVVLVILRNAILPAAAAGLILGAITGTAMVLLLRTARCYQETNIAPSNRAD